MKNITKNALLASFACAVMIEVSGYSLLNDSEGNNILCDMDPTCRKLTDAEITLLQTYMGDEIDYAQINFFEREVFWGLNFFSAPAQASYNAIFYPPLEKVHDSPLIQATIEKSTFVHEGAHIWQYQNTPYLQHWFNVAFQNSYDYELSDHDNFRDFGAEQEAKIVEMVFTFRHLISNPKTGAAFAMSAPEFSGDAISAEVLNAVSQRICENRLNPHEEMVRQVFPDIGITDCDQI